MTLPVPGAISGGNSGSRQRRRAGGTVAAYLVTRAADPRPRVHIQAACQHPAAGVPCIAECWCSEEGGRTALDPPCGEINRGGSILSSTAQEVPA